MAYIIESSHQKSLYIADLQANEGKRALTQAIKQILLPTFCHFTKFHSMVRYQAILFPIMPTSGKRKNYTDIENP